MNKIEQTLNLYNSFKNDNNGEEPLFARVKTDFDDNCPDCVYTIKLDWDKTRPTDEDPDDDVVFFYAHGMDELLGMLMPSETHDFTVTEVLAFQSIETFRDGNIAWIVRMDWVCDGDGGNDIVGNYVYKHFKDALDCFTRTVAKEKKDSWIAGVDPEDGDYYIHEEVFGNGRERMFEAYRDHEYNDLHTSITLIECSIY